MNLFGAVKQIPIYPMLAHGLKEGHTIEEYRDSHVLEEKYDGHRLIVEVGDEITAWSRAGNIRQLSGHICTDLSQIAPGIYDGELCVPGGISTDVVTIELLSKSKLVLFDLLQVSGSSTINKPTWERRTLLEAATTPITSSGAVVLAEQYLQPSQALLEKIYKRGGEGGILKKLDAPYEPDHRSRNWIKFKEERTKVMTIVGFLDGLLGPHSRILAVDEQGIEVRVKTLNDEWRRIFSTRAKEFIGAQLRVKYQLQTAKKGKYRHPMADHIILPDGKVMR